MARMTEHTLSPPQLIDEQVKACKLELVEGKEDKKGRVFARGEFGHAAKPTANGRFYRHNIWEGNITRLRPRLEEKKVLGELDHPNDGRTSLQRASHVITDLRLEGDRVLGEAEILDTAKGRDLKAILAAGVPVGISSRGFGSTKPGKDGIEEVQDDYKLVTFDFVAEPADDTAYPEVVFEATQMPSATMLFEGMEFEAPVTEDGVEEAVQTPDEQELAKRFAARVLSDAEGESELPTDEALREEFAAEILTRVESMRESIERQVRAEFLADPHVAGALQAIEQIREILQPFALSEDTQSIIAGRDETIQQLRDQLESLESQVAGQTALIETLTDAAREAGYRYHLECLLHEETPEVARIREIVGDVSQYESPETLQRSVTEAREEMRAVQLAEEHETRLHEERVSRLQEKNRELAEGLEQALQAQRDLALQVYAAKRLQTHPSGAKIQRMLEQVGLTSKEQIDALIEGFREPDRDVDDLDALRAKIRTRLSGGREHLQEDVQEVGRKPRGARNYNGLGASLAELRHLSGLRD